MNRVIHFEIQADNLERASKFYTDVFGWDIEEWKMPGNMHEGLAMRYFMVMTAPKDSKQQGINGGILPRMGGKPADGQSVNAYVCTMQVADIDAIIKKIEKAGGTLALAKFAFPGMAWQAYYKDTEGNIFGIHEPNKDAR